MDESDMELEIETILRAGGVMPMLPGLMPGIAPWDVGEEDDEGEDDENGAEYDEEETDMDLDDEFGGMDWGSEYDDDEDENGEVGEELEDADEIY